MSRWHLTSSQSADAAARVICEQAALSPAGECSGADLHLRSYFKRVVPIPNLIKCGEKDWICSAGTLIYNGRLGEEALRDCYANFVDSGISMVQAKAIGHYALAIRHSNEICIFTDPQGALNLYYIHLDSFWFVSNSLYVCANALPNRKIDSTKLLINALQSTLPGEDTFYSGVKRLFGTQQIRIDLRDGSFRVESAPKKDDGLSWKFPAIQDAIDQYKEEVRAVFKELTTVGALGLFGTGGMDSRTILAGVLDQQAPIQLMYGIGNSRLTDYDANDCELARSLAQRHDLAFRQLDWSGNQPHNEENLRALFRKYGFKFEIYGAPESFLSSFNGGISPYPGLFLGGYAPAFTNSKPWELTQPSFTFDDLVTDAMHYSRGSVEDCHCIADKATYRSVFSLEVRTGLRCAGIDFPDSGASLETFVKAKLFLYVRAESRFLNFVNEFGPYIAPFLMKRLHDPLLSVPLEFRAKDEFQLRLIHSLAPSLVEIPLHSGWGPAQIDRASFSLVRETPQPRGSLVRRVAGAVLPSIGRKLIRKVTGHAKQGNGRSADLLTGRDAEIVKTYTGQIMDDPLGVGWFCAMDEFTPKELARIRHYLVGVHALGYSE